MSRVAWYWHLEFLVLCLLSVNVLGGGAGGGLLKE